MEKSIDDSLKSIINLSTNISVLYQDLTDAKIKNKPNDILKELEYIKLASEVEEKEYKKMNLEENLDPKLYNRFSYLLRHSNAPEELHWLIIKRFENHINELLILNPFLSTSPYTSEQQEENEASITYQAIRDYSISSLYFLNQAIETEENEIVKQELIDYYHEFIFEQKSLSKYLLKAPEEVETSGRDRCIAFNQNPQMVDSCYKKVVKDALSDSIQIVVQYTDSFIKYNPNHIAGQKAYLSLIKAAIAIANPEENNALRFTATDEVLNFSGKSWQSILDSIKEANSLVTKALQKKKS